MATLTREQPLILDSSQQLACSLLRGEPQADGAVPGGADAAHFLSRMRYHGVATLLHERVAGNAHWPKEVLSGLRDDAVARGMWELGHQRLIGDLLARLAAAGIAPVLFKGTALAYSAYANPVTRTRSDTDLLIAEADRGAVHQTLLDLGFHVDCLDEMDLIRFQASYVWQKVGVGSHAVDLHWGISNSLALSHLFTYDELRAAAAPLPRLCPEALTANPIHALLIACMHRARHHNSAYRVDGVTYYSGDRLIWLYDIHLLATGFTPEQWRAFAQAAALKTLCGVCREGLERAQMCFGTMIPDAVWAALKAAPPSEQASGYLTASRFRQHWLDVRAVPGIRGQVRGAFELMFPPEAYMRSMFPDAQNEPLTWLYLRRASRRFAGGRGHERRRA